MNQEVGNSLKAIVKEISKNLYWVKLEMRKEIHIGIKQYY